MRLTLQPRGGRLTALAGSVDFLHKMSRRLQRTIWTEFHKLNRNRNIKVDEILIGFAYGHLLLLSNWDYRSFPSLEHIYSNIYHKSPETKFLTSRFDMVLLFV